VPGHTCGPRTGQPILKLGVPRERPSGRPPGPWLWQVFELWQDKGAAYLLERAWLRLRGPARYDPDWIGAHDTLTEADVAQIRARIARLAQRPVISIILSIGHGPLEAVRGTIESVIGQIYGHWELFVAGEVTESVERRKLVEGYASSDARIKPCFDSDDGPVAVANAVLTRVAGEFLLRLAAGGQLAPHALYLVAEEIDKAPEATIIYADEDEIDAAGRRANPHFKPDWNPDLFLSQNYLGAPVALRCDRVRDAGGFRAELADAADYDLVLRLIERVPGSTIRHVPFVLHHRNAGEGPAPRADQVSAPTRRAREQHALEQHLGRLGIDATVETSPSGRNLRVRRRLSATPMVSLIIPTRDGADVLKAAVDSILARTDYPDYEIVIVDNQSSQPEALAYLAALEREPRVRVLRFDRPFNFSAINNFAARQCTSPVLGLVNNDVLVIGGGWLRELVSHAVRPEVGAAGAMLYYPDDTIQHAGIIAGYGGTAVNCYAGLPRGSPGYFWRADAIQNYSAVTGACLLTRADVFAELGGFNETRFAIAFNDVDYCLRLRERGYLVTWTPFAELYHMESVSRGDDMDLDKRTRFRDEEAQLVRHWGRILANDPAYNPNLSLHEGLFQWGGDVRVVAPWRGEKPA
jgi:GT2 family glycosyltransferase